MRHEWTKDSQVVLALDPSGNYNEGKGVTGWCISNDGYIFSAGQIYAAEYPSQMEYWTRVLGLISSYKEKCTGKFQVVCEDYRLYASASESQINSNLETPQLIGAIKIFCHANEIPIAMQMASEVKLRWSDEVLKAKGILTMEGRTKRIGKIIIEHHSLDAVRHCVHYNMFKIKVRQYEKHPQINKLKFYSSY